MAGPSQKIALPVGYVSRGYCSGSKLGNIGTTCQRKMQLGYPPANLLHAYSIGCELVAFSGCFCRQQTLLFNEAIEIGAGQCPGITLVLDEAVHRGDRAALAIFDQLDRSKQRRNVRESSNLGEETADFDLGINALFPAAK